MKDPMTGHEVTQVETPRGVTAYMASRDGTSDLATVGATFRLWNGLHDEYNLGAERVEGVFVDVGAHIGTATVAVLLDNRRASAIAVEPLPENVAMIHENADRNGVGDRVQVLEGGVGDGKPITVRYGPDDAHRYIGDIRGATGETVTVPTFTLRQLIRLAGGRIDLLKTDCEGGEWPLLRGATKADLRKVARLVGEYHGDGPAFAAILSATHEVTLQPQDDGTGLFRAVLR